MHQGGMMVAEVSRFAGDAAVVAARDTAAPDRTVQIALQHCGAEYAVAVRLSLWRQQKQHLEPAGDVGTHLG